MIPYGTLVVLVTPQEKRYLKKIEENDNWQSHNGILPAEVIHNANPGEFVFTSQNAPILIEQATLQDILLGIKRQTQIIYPKDIAYICLRLGAGPNRVIAEAGCGSGSLTIALSWFCGSSGKIISQDAREEFVRLTARNLAWAGLGENVELRHQDVEAGFVAKAADALFMDMREPWLYLDKAAQAVKPGATVGFLLPTINQVTELLLSLEKQPFGNIEICELLLRGWKPVPDRVRPKDRMAAHTGFLIFCRQQSRLNAFSLQENLRTRERKEKSAWEKRNGEAQSR